MKKNKKCIFIIIVILMFLINSVNIYSYSATLDNDSGEIEVIETDEEVIETDEEVIETDEEVVETDQEVMETDGEIVEEDEEIVENEYIESKDVTYIPKTGINNTIRISLIISLILVIVNFCLYKRIFN